MLGGAFAGRVGVISELEGMHFARVTLGLMTARVAVEDLKPTADGAERPAVLRSSHWRPDAPAEPTRAPARQRQTGPRASRKPPRS